MAGGDVGNLMRDGPGQFRLVIRQRDHAARYINPTPRHGIGVRHSRIEQADLHRAIPLRQLGMDQQARGDIVHIRLDGGVVVQAPAPRQKCGIGAGATIALGIDTRHHPQRRGRARGQHRQRKTGRCDTVQHSRHAPMIHQRAAAGTASGTGHRPMIRYCARIRCWHRGAADNPTRSRFPPPSRHGPPCAVAGSR